MKGIGEKETDREVEQKTRKCENQRDKENYIQRWLAASGHLGWEDETEDRCEVIKVLCWPHED